jgi:hypothetical protein
MTQYVLTRSAYGPAWDRAANARRLAMTRAVTARLMAAQTVTDWTWVVLLDERDPNLRARLALYGDSAPAFVPLVVRPETERSRDVRQRIASAGYLAKWRSVIPSDDTALLTRLDDDDGFTPDALARYRAAAQGIVVRTALMLPMGIHLWQTRYSVVCHERNAMHTLVTPPGDVSCVYDYNHTKVRDHVPVKVVDREWGWLWMRHDDTISGARNPVRWGGTRPAPINPTVRQSFPIDWSFLFPPRIPGPPRRPSPTERAKLRKQQRVQR